MPNTRIRDKWEPLVKNIVADHLTWGPRRILEELKRRAKKHGLSNDYPSERTIQRMKKDITPKEMEEYRSLRWPESMERGDLPWEASHALELLRYCNDKDWGRPPIRLARWYWRVSLAAPDAPLDVRFMAASQLAALELLGKSSSVNARAIEWYLAYGEWRGDEARQDYDAAIRRPGAEPGLAEQRGDWPIFRPPRYAFTHDVNWSDEELLMLLGLKATHFHAEAGQPDTLNTKEANNG